MSPMQARLPPGSRRATAAASLLFLPLVLSWGVGTAGPVLDRLAVPAAILADVPARLGLVGGAVVLLLSLVRLRIPAVGSLVDALGLWGLLSLLGPAVAATRPLPWVPALVAFWWWGRGRAAPGSAFDLSPGSRGIVGALAWIAAGRVRPFGPGLLPVGVEDGIAALVGHLPESLLAAPAGLAAIGAAVLLARRRAPDRVGALLGAGVGLLLESIFGLDSAWLSGALIGAVAGAWPLSFGRVERAAGPILLAAALAALRVGGLERWNCGAIVNHPTTKLLLARDDFLSLGVVPGNLPYLVALRGDGSTLERFSTTGVINETRPVDPPGGLLVSTGGDDAPVLRLVDGGDGLIVEWWKASVMERIAVVRTDEPCEAEDAGYEPVSERVWAACADGDVVAVDPKHPAVRWDLPGWTRDLDQAPGSVVRLRRGPLGHLVLRDPDGAVQAAAFVGPWAEDADPGPERLVVAHGPSGQISLRGAPPRIPGRPGGDPDLAGLDALKRDVGHVLDRARVGNWPSEVHWSIADRSVYVTSAVDARVTLVDAEVPWHQADAPLGAPPRQVVLDSPSGTLYGVNRCGVFEVRILSTFPWASTGDVEEPPKESDEVPRDPR
jgi:hypothetical protein